MKKILVILASLLLFAFPAFAEPMGTFDYTDDLKEDGSPIYYFQDISLTLPAAWRGKVWAVQGENGVSFHQISSYQKFLEEGISNGGFLFGLGASVNNSFTDLPAYEYLGFSEKSYMNYYLILPTDYPVYNDPDIMAEYNALYAQIDYVAENAYIYPTQEQLDAAAGEIVSDEVLEEVVESYEAEEPEMLPPYSEVTDAGKALSEEADALGEEAEAPEAEPGDEAAGTGEEAEESGEEDVAPEEEGWTVTEVRYAFEHNMLPKYFFYKTDSLLDGIDSVGMYPLWASVAEENGVDPTYDPEDFGVRWYVTDDGTELAQIELPYPEESMLCYRIYLAYNASTGKARYFTVERDNFLYETSFACEWTDEMEHINYGSLYILDPDSEDYEQRLLEEADIFAQLVGSSAEAEEEAG